LSPYPKPTLPLPQPRHHLWVALSFLAVVASLRPAAAQEPRRDVVDRIVAVIENEIVTLRELEEKANDFLSELDPTMEGLERERRRQEIMRRVLDIEIDEKLMAKEVEANRDKLGVTEKDIDRAVDTVLAQYNMTREQLQATLYGQGLTWSEYRQKLRQQMEGARLIQAQVQGKVQINESEVKRRCEERQSSGATQPQVCVAHILLSVPEGASEKEIEARRNKAAKLKGELAAGGDFAAYALTHSDDKSTPDGDLGCFARGQMVEAFEDAAFNTKPGEISDITRTNFGFHIIKVRELKAAASRCSSEPQLAPFRDEIYQQEIERQRVLWLANLRKKSFVDIRL